jgi:hypothetical protein
MSTFIERYCARHGCAPHEFRQSIFWRTLPWHAVPLAPLLLLGNHFKSDRRLIDACGRATCLHQIHEEIYDRPHRRQISGWLRRHAKLGISKRRLHQLAECYLPNRHSTPQPRSFADRPIAADRPGTNRWLDARLTFPGGCDPVASAINAGIRFSREIFLKPPGPKSNLGKIQPC